MRSRSPYMVYTAVPPDNCDNDIPTSLQHAHLGVNSMNERDPWHVRYPAVSVLW